MEIESWPSENMPPVQLPFHSLQGDRLPIRHCNKVWAEGGNGELKRKDKEDKKKVKTYRQEG
jgi:hypothetical protein